MAYIGKQPVVGNFVKLDAIVTSATATYNLLNGGVAYFPQTANNCIVSLNGVIQSPTSAYTISGSTIVFDSALTSADSIDFILVLGDVLAIGTPSDGTVTAAKLASGTDGLFAWQSVQTTGFTAVAARAYPCNTTSAAFTVTLPASPSVGDQVLLLDYAGTFATNNITLGRNSNKIEGGITDKKLTTNREAVTLTYVDATQGWVSSSGANEGTVSIDPLPPYSVDFLVIAGGGSGGSYPNSGGGGAGGYRTSTQTVATGTVITVTVGDGGASTSGAVGNVGSSSSISGSGLTTISSAGGGRGGGGDGVAGGNGGSGGGGGSLTTSAGGSGNTPSTSPSQGNNGGQGFGTASFGGGGGGGAGAVGGNASSPSAGNGGNGTASSITGSSITYAGGGGGQGEIATNAGTGGTGGGGAGNNNGNATAGTVNTGSGGGAARNGSSGAGGKGIVILSVPTASYSGTSTGSPTITTTGIYTILSFTGTGSYTA
jgi:hypothetical protein